MLEKIRKKVALVSAIVPVLFRNGFNTEMVAKIAHRTLLRHSSSCQSCQLPEDKGPSSTRNSWISDPRYEELNKHSTLLRKLKDTVKVRSKVQQGPPAAIKKCLQNKMKKVGWNQDAWQLSSPKKENKRKKNSIRI